MKKQIDLVWNAYKLRWNDELKVFNVFDHRSFYEGVLKLLKAPLTKEEFSEKLRREVQYYYWAKTEWELIIAECTPKIDQKEFNRILSEYYLDRQRELPTPYSTTINISHDDKIDVYDQLYLNWDAFVDYVWKHKPVPRKRVQK